MPLASPVASTLGMYLHTPSRPAFTGLRTGFHCCVHNPGVNPAATGICTNSQDPQAAFEPELGPISCHWPAPLGFPGTISFSCVPEPQRPNTHQWFLLPCVCPQGNPAATGMHNNQDSCSCQWTTVSLALTQVCVCNQPITLQKAPVTGLPQMGVCTPLVSPPPLPIPILSL